MVAKLYGAVTQRMQNDAVPENLIRFEFARWSALARPALTAAIFQAASL